MKYIVLLAMFVIVVQAPSDLTIFQCFETTLGTSFCLIDRTWVCGNCGAKRVYCEAKAAGRRNPPTKASDAVCARTPKPQC